jgi:dihydroorotase
MVIKNAIIYDAFEIKRVDITIKDGYIKKLGKSSKRAKKSIDANGLIVIPSLVDLNINMDSLSINSLKKHSSKAIRGGISHSLINPNISNTKIDNEMSIEFINRKSEVLSSKILPMCCGASNGVLNNISSLIKTGAKSVYIDSSYDINIIKRVFEYAKMLDIVVFCSCNDPKLSLDGVISSGKIASKLGLPTISKSAEFTDVAKIAYLADSIGVDVVFQTLSTKNSINIIDSISSGRLKKEISIHHLLLNDEVCDNFNSYGKLLPPLRDENLRSELVKLLKDGKFDTITSFSSYFKDSTKDRPFAEASFGINVVEYYANLLYTLSVKERVDLTTLIKLASFNSGEILGVDSGVIREGSKADLILIDPNQKSEIDKNSPYNEVLSKTIKHFVNGCELF